MTNPFNLSHQIKRVLNRHSEDPSFGNLVSALQNASSDSDIDDACLVVAFEYLAKRTDALSYKAFKYLKNNLKRSNISTVQDIIDTADKARLL